MAVFWYMVGVGVSPRLEFSWAQLQLTNQWVTFGVEIRTEGVEVGGYELLCGQRFLVVSGSFVSRRPYNNTQCNTVPWSSFSCVYGTVTCWNRALFYLCMATWFTECFFKGAPCTLLVYVPLNASSLRYGYSTAARDLWSIATRAGGWSPRVRVWLLTINPMATVL